MSGRTVCLTLLLGWGAACVGGDSDDAVAVVAEAHGRIIGGEPEADTPAVMMIQLPAGYACSATLVGERIALTAAHCVVDDVLADRHGGVAYFGPSVSSAVEQVPIVRLMMHPFYNFTDVRQFDIALVRLAEAPPGITPMPINLAPLGLELIGSQVRAVGYGVDDATADSSAGTKRSVNLAVELISDRHVGYGGTSTNTCQGDSGGPILLEIDGVETVIGVVSYGANFCTAQSKATRPDVHADFLVEVLDSWEGPCRFNGTCEADCPRTPDPDCDLCGFEGVCASDCPKLDLDCGPFGFLGDVCVRTSACVEGVCVRALDDPSGKYCSVECSDSGDCTAPLSWCEQNVCHYPGPSIGSQGWACSDDRECRSGTCDPDDDLCVEPCDPEADSCPEFYQCGELPDGSAACRAVGGEGGCGCRSAGRGGASGGVLLLLLLCAVCMRARRLR